MKKESVSPQTDEEKSHFKKSKLHCKKIQMAKDLFFKNEKKRLYLVKYFLIHCHGYEKSC